MWRGSDLRGTGNSLTQNGYLQMAGYQQELIDDQQYALDKSYMQEQNSYGMTFTLNLKRMGNEGRVMLCAIPRTADASFNIYYARFQQALQYSDTNKIVGLSEIGVLPSVDLMYADNACWSFFITWNG